MTIRDELARQKQIYRCREVNNATLRDTVSICNTLTEFTNYWVNRLDASRPTDPNIMRLREELLLRLRVMQATQDAAVGSVMKWSNDQIDRNFPLCRGEN